MVGGKGPFGYIDMGGMFTILKVRDQLAGDATRAGTRRRCRSPVEATADELTRDGIEP